MAGHVSPKSTYYAIFGALMVLTIVTIYVAYQPLGSWNFPVAISIAITKATLVILFFMHLRYDKLFHTVVFVSALLGASLFVGFTLMDTSQYQQTNIWQPSRPPAAPFGPRPTTG